ncbi:MAG: hypothetical protein NUV86_07350 [Candidatus Scalindua sp.]|nr:hypothetical protein [Candidatus Scalindua sp.]MCR4344788.1 hypothetical protein [Candidatus Scalindua sp.]
MANEDNWFPTEKNIANYSLLKDMLNSQRHEFNLLSKKNPDVQLNLIKVKMVNRVLEPLNEILKHELSHKFLDILSEDDIPTNSDVVLIISQYETAISEFRGKYYIEDKYQYTHRWMTQEFLPDYYATNESEEDYEDNE